MNPVFQLAHPAFEKLPPRRIGVLFGDFDQAAHLRLPALQVRPHLLAAEEEFVKKNTFQLTYEPFDWRLNDLTGGRPD